ncbi:tail fiber assembly protein [Serratia sp. BIGb0163]|uniref:tail fiber assembly protein n=1 Tax=Serratia sp. BIGb0163 TaxID=2940613 RepID=UPI003866A6B0
MFRRATLAAWKSYLVLLSRVDTDKAPDIECPASPAKQPSAPLIAKAQRKKK